MEVMRNRVREAACEAGDQDLFLRRIESALLYFIMERPRTNKLFFGDIGFDTAVNRKAHEAG